MRDLGVARDLRVRRDLRAVRVVKVVIMGGEGLARSGMGECKVCNLYVQAS